MRRGRLLLACALVVLVGVLPVAAASSGTATTAVHLGENATSDSDRTITAQPGETVTVTVWANATDVSGYQANVTFDSSVVSVQSVSRGKDFEKPVSNVNNDAGWVAFNQIRSSETTDPVLAELTFTVTGDADDTAEISFVGADTKLSDGDGETSSPQSHGVTLNVEAADGGDDTNSSDSGGDDTNSSDSSEDDTNSSDSSGDDTNSSDSSGDDTNSSDTGDDTNTNDGSEDDDTTNAGGGSDDTTNAGSGSSVSHDTEGSASTPSEPSFSIEEANLSTSSSSPGSPVTVSAIVENTGDATGTFDARVYVDGNATETNRTVEVKSGQRRRVNLSLRFDSPGTYAVAVGNTTVGNVTVQEERTATSSPTEAVTATATATPQATSSPSATATGTAAVTATPKDSTPSPTATETTTDSTSTGETVESMPGFGFGAALATIATLVGWVGRRRGGSD